MIDNQRQSRFSDLPIVEDASFLSRFVIVRRDRQSSRRAQPQHLLCITDRLPRVGCSHPYNNGNSSLNRFDADFRDFFSIRVTQTHSFSSRSKTNKPIRSLLDMPGDERFKSLSIDRSIALKRGDQGDKTSSKLHKSCVDYDADCVIPKNRRQVLQTSGM